MYRDERRLVLTQAQHLYSTFQGGDKVMRRLRLTFLISLAIFAMLGQSGFAQQPDYMLGSSEARAESGWFFKRLFNVYRNEFLGQEVIESAPEPPWRALPSSWDSPP